MKKLFFLAFAAIASLTFTACNNQEPETTDTLTEDTVVVDSIVDTVPVDSLIEEVI